MKRHLTQLILLFVYSMSLSISHEIQAQNVFWAENFSNGKPSDWSNYDASHPVMKWDFDDDPTANLWFPQPPFAANSANNGFMYFDSDIVGLAHDVRLETSAIDCSNQDTVIIHFENQYDYVNSTSEATLEVSTDSSSWTSFDLFVGHPPHYHREHVQVIELDISSIAANESTVFLRFRWVGHKEYIWRLDDIRLQDDFSPPVANDVTMGAMGIAPNFKTPIDHVKAIEFGGDVKNLGTNTAYNVLLEVTVIDTLTGAILHYDSKLTSFIPPGDSVLVSMNNVYIPDAQGFFNIIYEVSMDSSDQRRWNDELVFPFEVTDSVFRKNFPYSLTHADVQGQVDYEVGNLYEAISNDTYADKVLFTVWNNLPLTNKSVEIKIYEIASHLNSNLDGFQDSDATLVGGGSHTFTTLSNFASMVAVDVKSNDSTKLHQNIHLKSNTRYFVMVAFKGASQNVQIGLDDSFPYEFEVSTIVKLGVSDWRLRGFGARLTAEVILQITSETGVNTTNVDLNEHNVELYPNPTTSDYLNILFDLEELETDLTIEVSDILGRNIYDKIFSNIHKDEIQLDIRDLSAGTYLLNIISSNGQQTTKRFVVK